MPNNDNNMDPAWVRGCDVGVAAMCTKVNDILDGKDKGDGVAGDPLVEKTRRRLLALMEKQ